MKIIDTLLLAALLLLTPLATRAQTPQASSASHIATEVLDKLDAHDYTGVEAMFSTKMAEAVPADKLQAVWESLPTQAGAARGRGEPQTREENGMQLAEIPLHYEQAELVAKIAIDAEGKVAGLLIQPAAAAPAPPPPADASYRESDLSVGDGDKALPGTLAMPAGDAPAAGFPAVVLVQGSGPHDRDETIGPNRPFLDIARGLAAQGVAVLRFDKRTQARPQDYANGGVTIDSETTDDAVTAVATLAAQPGIDPARVFVLGHSQGGMMAPRIAAHAKAAGTPVAGLVLLAAPSRKLLDILIEQTRRLAVLDDGHIDDTEAAAIARLKSQVKAVRSGEEVPAAESPMQQPAAYWRSTDQVDPVAEAVADDLPMLIAQGARDIQVVDADWQRWKAAFHDNPKVTFKLYDKLNHLGIPGEGDGNLAEYSQPGHVDPQLIDDVATWVKAH